MIARHSVDFQTVKSPRHMRKVPQPGCSRLLLLTEIRYYSIPLLLIHCSVLRHVWRTSRRTFLGFNDDPDIFFFDNFYNGISPTNLCFRLWLQLGLGGCKVILPIFILWIYIILWIWNSFVHELHFIGRWCGVDVLGVWIECRRRPNQRV